MYPYLRMIKEIVKYRNAPPLGAFETHVSHHICWPWDIDPWLELNNGRTLTLYDLGRIPMATRTGLDKIARAKGWGLAVAGASVRYRKRVKTFDRIEMRTRLLGWDARFVYMDQSMWVRGECTSQALLRSAITQGKRGIVPPAEMAVALGLAPESPPLPGWVTAWSDADAQRPWPPVA
ncbi:acyl-CoA thioesterase [Pseudogemmobacter blasticus]|uniref:Thioeseterase n=1 Tax=Fuscovulum blasticum DSM 2131 TaxID=1188250 RepID=A0A2T4JEQ4_FUSBL|nr:acyl-CoA thioesterase [Fuscovulum blasticum]PTE16402.1 thioeseterase [Fuscovulum blasticum DSM 2131]